MEMQSFRIAAVQFDAGDDPADNLARLEPLLCEACETSDYVQTPEMTNLFGGAEAQARHAVPMTVDRALARVCELAKETATFIHLGSLAVRHETDARLANRSVLVGPDGRVRAWYDKLHLFDVDLASGRVRESERYAPGARLVTADLGPLRLGFSVCFDLRFPALYRRLAQSGATLLVVPSAFFSETGAKHWHALLRARAIETGSFVVAAAQCGRHPNGRETYGHSLIIGPDGAVLAERPAGPGVVTATIDPAEAWACRRAIPTLDDGPMTRVSAPPMFRAGGPA